MHVWPKITFFRPRLMQYCIQSSPFIPTVQCFFHQPTNTACYVVADEESKCCHIIDSVSDFDITTGKLTYTHADQVISFIKEKNYQIGYILETHIHADHITGSPYIRRKLGGGITAISERITSVQKKFSEVFNIEYKTDGSQFQKLWSDNEVFFLGSHECFVYFTPGHTPTCVTYHIGDAIFTGDTCFMPDCGTARCDFAGGSADQLYQSVKRLQSLPENLRWFVGHDYPNGRDLCWETTVKEQKSRNKHINDLSILGDFVKARTQRDSELSIPRLFYPAIQLNINAGFPIMENSKSFLKIPLQWEDKEEFS